MGATIDLFLEYDDSTAEPFSAAVDGVIDFTKSINIVYCKPYPLMQAIAGVRGDSEIKPKIPPRGFPKQRGGLRDVANFRNLYDVTS